MQVHHGYENLSFSNPVVTLGIFDGVHKGHRALIDTLVTRAKEVSGESVIVTLYPHPRLVLSENDSGLTFLTSLDEKIDLLEKTGVDHLVIVSFDRELGSKDACDFIRDILIKKLGARYMIVGFNHHFGRDGEGSFDTVNECSELFNFKVEQIEAVDTGSGIISSSAIRDALLNGNLEEANQLLGYDYFMNGTIVRGKEIGRKIGYPTANIKPDYSNKLIPKNGVYAVEVYFGEDKYAGVMSIGLNPTVNKNSGRRTIEVNIFNFQREIYGEKVRIVFRFRLRDEIKFVNISELVKQIETDRDEAVRLLYG